MSYLGNALSEYNYSRTPLEFTATQGQTTFAAFYRTGFAEFYRNGVRLSASDVRAINGTSFTLTSPCAAGDVVAVLPNTEFKAGQTGTTANQFDSSASLATTEFVQRALGNMRGLYTFSTSTAIPKSAAGSLISSWGAAGPITFTIPNSDASTQGLQYVVVNPTPYALTLNCTTGFWNVGGGNSTSVTVPAGLYVSIISDGASWMVSGQSGPTPPQFDNDTSIATTEFVRRQGMQYAGLPTVGPGTTLDASHVGKLVVLFDGAGAGGTVTLPDAAVLPDGAVIDFINGTGLATYFIAPKGGATINKIAGSVAIVSPSLLRFMVYGGAWIQYGDKFQTPPQFDNDNSIATTAFVQRAAGNFQDVYHITTTPVSLSAADVGKVLNCFGSASSVTLPNGAGCNRGSAFVVYTSKEVIFNAYSGDAIVAYPGAGSTVTSVTIPANTTAVLFWTGGAWNVAVHGAGTSNQSANGYQKLPSGLLIQWGTFLASASADVAVTFPVAFPNAVFSLATTQAGQNAMFYSGYNTPTPIGFNGSAWLNSTTRGSTIVSYIAIGR